MRRVKAIASEDQLSLVEHLDELRAHRRPGRRFRSRPRPSFWQDSLLPKLTSGPLPPLLTLYELSIVLAKVFGRPLPAPLPDAPGGRA